MKAKENAKNDSINPQTEALRDLPVADEQADETTAGNTQAGYNTWRTNFGRTS